MAWFQFGLDGPGFEHEFIWQVATLMGMSTLGLAWLVEVGLASSRSIDLDQVVTGAPPPSCFTRTLSHA